MWTLLSLHQMQFGPDPVYKTEVWPPFWERAMWTNILHGVSVKNKQQYYFPHSLSQQKY